VSFIGCKWSLPVLGLIKLYKFGIIDKKIYPETPPKVEYSFTEFGKKFFKIVDVVENLQRDLDREE
jgi:DNA-binding HxlR family transcriptional regulator